MTDTRPDILKDCTVEKYTKPKTKIYSLKIIEFDANFRITKFLWWKRKEKA